MSLNHSCIQSGFWRRVGVWRVIFAIQAMELLGGAGMLLGRHCESKCVIIIKYEALDVFFYMPIRDLICLKNTSFEGLLFMVQYFRVLLTVSTSPTPLAIE